MVSPWDTINTPKKNYYTKRLVSDEISIPCFWAKDSNDSLLFLIELTGDFKEFFIKNNLKINGISLDLRHINNKQYLILVLEQYADYDLFESLCKSLADSLRTVSSSELAIKITFRLLKRWRFFLGGRVHLLSVEQVRGLFGELLFLKKLIKLQEDNKAIKAWKGPEKLQHDFVFQNKTVEIKSLLGTERNNIQISSEDQLESLNEKLFLIVYRLIELNDNKGSKSLNELIDEILEIIDDSHVQEIFVEKLNAYGYVPLPNYDDPKFFLKESRVFEVTENFPRLIKSELPPGISNLCYRLDLHAISSFKSDLNRLFGRKDG